MMEIRIILPNNLSILRDICEKYSGADNDIDKKKYYDECQKRQEEYWSECNDIRKLNNFIRNYFHKEDTTWTNNLYGLQTEAVHEPAHSTVDHPNHYTWLKDVCGIEVIDLVRHFDFNLGNSLKYILRSGHKTEQGYTCKEKTIEDLKKAIWYLQDEINTLTNE